MLQEDLLHKPLTLWFETALQELCFTHYLQQIITASGIYLPKFYVWVSYKFIFIHFQNFLCQSCRKKSHLEEENRNFDFCTWALGWSWAFGRCKNSWCNRPIHIHFLDSLSVTLVYAAFHYWQQNCCIYIASTSGCNVHNSEMPNADILLWFTILLKCLLIIWRVLTHCFHCIARLFHNKIRISAGAYEKPSLGIFHVNCSWMVHCITYIPVTETRDYSSGLTLLVFTSIISSFGYSFYYPFGVSSNVEDG